jgi:GcrA cell cycle regulator
MGVRYMVPDTKRMREEGQNMWTEEENQILEREWKAGSSASQIAAMLNGKTRNAVIGKIHRIQARAAKLAGTWCPENRHPVAKRIYLEEPKPKKRHTTNWSIGARNKPTKPHTPNFEPFKKAFAPLPVKQERVDDGCKWPVGEKMSDPDFHCGAPRRDDRCSYCKAHAAIAYEPASREARWLTQLL